MAKRKIDPKVARLLDANFNRAREGIRVVEDAVRFVLDDAKIYASLRRLRHRLGSVQRARNSDLLESRNSEKDAGRVLAEKEKRSLDGLITANFKRAQEATRVLEEYGKLFSASSAKELKAVRFQLYIMEKKVVRKFK